MSYRCSICLHAEVALINVSLLRDGTRAAARQFEVSRSALDRHKRHLKTTRQIQEGETADQNSEADSRSDGSSPPLATLDALMLECQQTLIQAKASKNSSHVVRALKEVRTCLELKLKLATEKPASMPSRSNDHQRRRLGDVELCIRLLQKICLYTKDFDPLRIWQLKTLHDMAMNFVQSEMPQDEIARQMTLRTPDTSDVSFEERVFGLVRAEEWQGREKEIAKAIVGDIREGLKNHPSILKHLDDAFADSPATLVIPRRPVHHHVGPLSKPKVLYSPYCGPA